MVPQVVTLGPVAVASAALIAASQTPVSGTALTLTGTQPDIARRILLTYGTEVANRTLTVSGTNHTGNPIGETLSVPLGGGGTIATQQDFLTVTQLMPLGGGWSAAVTVGTNSVASGPWKVLEMFQQGDILFDAVLLAGAGTFSVEYTPDDPNNIIGVSNVPPVAFNVPTMGSLTATADGNMKNGPYAWRLTISAGSTARVRASAIQTGIRN